MKNTITYFLLAILLSLCIHSAFAQQGITTVGIKAAYGVGDLEVKNLEQLSRDLVKDTRRINHTSLGSDGETRYSFGFTAGHYVWDQLKLEAGISFAYFDYPFEGAVNIIEPHSSQGSDVGLAILPETIEGKNQYYFLDFHVGARIFPGKGASQTRFFFFPNFVASNYLSNRRSQDIFFEDGTILKDVTGEDEFTDFRSWTFAAGLGFGLEFHLSPRIDLTFMANLNVGLNLLDKNAVHEKVHAACSCLNLNLDYRL